MCLCHSELIFFDTQTRAWEEVSGVKGAEWKVFQTDLRTGGVQALVKFPAGAMEPPHHHTYGHWVYVLEGCQGCGEFDPRQEVYPLQWNVSLHTSTRCSSGYLSLALHVLVRLRWSL